MSTDPSSLHNSGSAWPTGAPSSSLHVDAAMMMRPPGMPSASGGYGAAGAASGAADGGGGGARSTNPGTAGGGAGGTALAAMAAEGSSAGEFCFAMLGLAYEMRRWEWCFGPCPGNLFGLGLVGWLCAHLAYLA